MVEKLKLAKVNVLASNPSMERGSSLPVPASSSQNCPNFAVYMLFKCQLGLIANGIPSPGALHPTALSLRTWWVKG